VETIIIAGEGFQALTASGDLSVWSGNDSFDFTLPNVVTKATITATYTTGFSQVQQVLDIGIGEQNATPKPPSGPTGLFSNFESNLKWIAITCAPLFLTNQSPSVANVRAPLAKPKLSNLIKLRLLVLSFLRSSILVLSSANAFFNSSSIIIPSLRIIMNIFGHYINRLSLRI